MIRIIYTILFLGVSIGGLAQGEDIIGKWKTIDDETGEAKSIVEIYRKGDFYFGKVVKIYQSPDKDPDPVCKKCPEDDPRFGKKILGMEIIKDLKKTGKEYVNGTVLKPDEGKVYKCKIWMENQTLQVRGYWGLFYRTQSWVKSK